MKELTESQERRMTARVERLEAKVDEMNKNAAVQFENILTLLKGDKAESSSRND